jgi:hypothetical protein
LERSIFSPIRFHVSYNLKRYTMSSFYPWCLEERYDQKGEYLVRTGSSRSSSSSRSHKGEQPFLCAVFDLGTDDDAITSDDSTNYDPPKISGQDDNVDLISHTLTTDNSANYDPPKIHQVISGQEGNFNVIPHDSDVGLEYDKGMFYTSTSFSNSIKNPTDNQSEIEQATSFEHSIAADEQAGLILQQLHDKVRLYYHLFQSDSSFLLTCHHYLFTYRTLDQRLLQSIDHINSWLRSVEEAKQVLLHHIQQEQEAAGTFFSISTNLRGDTQEDSSYHPTGTTSLTSAYLTPSTMFTTSSSTPTDDSSLTSKSTMGVLLSIQPLQMTPAQTLTEPRPSTLLAILANPPQ